MANQTKSDLSPEAQARVDFVRSIVPKRKPKVLVKLAALAVVVIVFVCLIWLIASGGSSAPKKAEVHKSNIPAAVDLNANVATTSYNSSFFNMSLSYPKTWTLKDSGKGLLTITSPLSNLVAASGTPEKGQIILSVTAQGQLPAGLNAGTNLAVLNSAVASYTNPSTSQAGQTYISFLQLSTTNTVGGLDGVYATGNFGYQKDQVISTSDLSSLNPLIYVSFTDCATKTCKAQMPLTIASASWGNTPLGQIITSIIQSFVFN